MLDTVNGRKLWGQNIGGAIGGGVVTYSVNGTQKIAVAKGLTEILWPTEITTAKVLKLDWSKASPTASRRDDRRARRLLQFIETEIERQGDVISA